MNVSEDFRYVSDEGFVESEAFLKHCSVEYDGDFVEGFRNWWKDSQELKKQKGNKGWQWNPIQVRLFHIFRTKETIEKPSEN